MVVASQTKVDGLINVGGYKLTGNELVVRAEEILLQNLESALQRLGARLADNLEMNAPMGATGKLKSTFGQPVIRETKIGYRIEIKTDAEYFDYIDKGVKGIQNRRKTYPNAEGKHYQYKTYGMPPEALQQLQGWMERKNIEIEATNLRIKYGDESMAGRQMLPQISSSAKRLAYYIKKYGIAGTNFIQKSVDQSKPQFNIDIQTIGADSLVLKVSK